MNVLSFNGAEVFRYRTRRYVTSTWQTRRRPIFQQLSETITLLYPPAQEYKLIAPFTARHTSLCRDARDNRSRIALMYISGRVMARRRDVYLRRDFSANR